MITESDENRHHKKESFLAVFARCGNITAAAKAANICRSSHYDWLREPGYAAQFERAREHAVDSLVDEAVQRAYTGEREIVIADGKPVFVWVDQAGEVVPAGDERAVRETPLYRVKKSDCLMIFLLKAAKPEQFNRRQVEPPVAPSGPMNGAVPMTVEARRQRLNEIIDGIRRRQEAAENGDTDTESLQQIAAPPGGNGVTPLPDC